MGNVIQLFPSQCFIRFFSYGFLEEYSGGMKRLLKILLMVFFVGARAETIEYRDGTYTGELVNGVLHGQGIYTHTDGEK